jgi:hypothetical protein
VGEIECPGRELVGDAVGGAEAVLDSVDDSRRETIQCACDVAATDSGAEAAQQRDPERTSEFVACDPIDGVVRPAALLDLAHPRQTARGQPRQGLVDLALRRCPDVRPHSISAATSSGESRWTAWDASGTECVRT